MLQCLELFWRTVEETILHLRDLSIHDFWQITMKVSHLLGIMQLLHETGILLYSRNPKGLGLCADSVDKVVVRYCCCADGTLDIRGIAESDSLVDALQRN